MKPINILIADDRHLLRKGLKSLITEIEGLNLIGEVYDKKDLRHQLTLYKPDLLVLGFSFDSFEEVNDIKSDIEESAATKVMYIGDRNEKEEIFKMLKLDLRSYILTECDEREIIDAIWAAGKNKRFVCGKILDTITESDRLNAELGITNTCEPINLSEREIEVIQFIAKEYSNRQIAEKLYLSEHTVRTHRKNIMHKTGAGNIAGLMMYAVRHELVNPLAII